MKTKTPRTLGDDDPYMLATTMAGANTALVMFATLLMNNLPPRSRFKAKAVAEALTETLRSWEHDATFDSSVAQEYLRGSLAQMTQVVEMCDAFLPAPSGFSRFWSMSNPTAGQRVEIPDWIKGDDESFPSWLDEIDFGATKAPSFESETVDLPPQDE